MVTAAVAVLVSLPGLFRRIYEWERGSVSNFVNQYSDLCDYEMKIWNDDLQLKVMCVDITSKLDKQDRIRIGRIHGASISEDHFHLVNIGGKYLHCYPEDHQGRRIAQREGIDIGERGPFRSRLNIKSLGCLVRRHDEIVDIINTWPGQDDEHGTLATHYGQLRYYAAPSALD